MPEYLYFDNTSAVAELIRTQDVCTSAVRHWPETTAWFNCVWFKILRFKLFLSKRDRTQYGTGGHRSPDIAFIMYRQALAHVF